MNNSAWMIICLLLICKCYRSEGSSTSTGAGTAPQTCGTDNIKFYCPYDPDETCKPRIQRCTGSNICNNPSTKKEEGCSETSNPGEYYVFVGHAELFDSSSSRKKRNIFEHRFVTFRGFTYEFGKSYGVQVLDITDPIYKYKDGKHLKGKRIERIGRSYCNWEDANKVVEQWKSKEYHLATNNCQRFAKALSYVLINGPCNKPAASRGKRQDNEAEFSQYVDRQLRNCSLVCCYDDSSVSSAIAVIHNHSLVIFVFVTIIYLAFFV